MTEKLRPSSSDDSESFSTTPTEMRVPLSEGFEALLAQKRAAAEAAAAPHASEVDVEPLEVEAVSDSAAELDLTSTEETPKKKGVRIDDEPEVEVKKRKRLASEEFDSEPADPHSELVGKLKELMAKRAEENPDEVQALLSEKVATDPRFAVMDALARKIAQAHTAHADPAEVIKLEDQLNDLLVIYEKDKDYNQFLAYAIIDKTREDIPERALGSDSAKAPVKTPEPTTATPDHATTDSGSTPDVPAPESDDEMEIRYWQYYLNRALIEFANLKQKLSESRFGKWAKEKLGGPENKDRRKKIIRRGLGIAAIVGVTIIASKFNLFDETPHFGDGGVGVDGVDVLGK